MLLTINGEQIQTPENVVFVEDLLNHFGLQQKVVIVETNGMIIEKSSHAETRLTDGDRIEIVHFVGGG